MEVKNNGSKPANDVKCYLFFFKGGKFINSISGDFTDIDKQIKPGKSEYREVFINGYDDVQVYFKGYIAK